MKRKAFLLGLVGAVVAKAQTSFDEKFKQLESGIQKRLARNPTALFTAGGCMGVRDGSSNYCDPLQRAVGEHLVPAVSLKPKPGHCPLDGTKGELHAMTSTFQLDLECPQGETCTTMGIEVLRCPHCGILFTATEVEP